MNGIRLRAIIFGLVIGLALCAATPYNNAYLNATPLAGGHFPLAPFFVLVWLTVVVALVSRIRGKVSLFTGIELLTVWIICVVVSGLGFTGLVRTFFINITAPYYFAGGGNKWAETLQPLLPKSWYPQDPAAIETLYKGLPGGRGQSVLEVFGNIPWDVWLGPLLTWSVFILLCYFVMICLVNIFSRQWVTNERVNFPLLRVPQLMTEAVDEQRLWSFLTNRYLLAGAGGVVLLHTLNGLSFYFPTVPQLPTLILAGPYFPPTGIFSGFYKLKIYIYPAFIGFAFLTTRQISFSFWLFYLLGCLAVGIMSVTGLSVPDSALGVTFGTALSKVDEAQMIGAYPVFFLFLLYLSRTHLKEVAARAFIPGRAAKGGHKGAGEWAPVRYSLWGFFIGLGALTFWCVHFGVPLIPALCLLAAFFMVMIVSSRLVCQGGVPYMTLTAAPSDGIMAAFGSKFFGSAGLVVSVVMQKMLFVDLRESLMPSLFHAAKVSERARRGRMMLVGIALALVLAVGVSLLSMLIVCHKFGIRELSLDWAAQTTLTVYENAQRLIENPEPPKEWVLVFAGAGAALMFLLVAAYHRFYWWPIHPIGYLAAYSTAMRMLWFSFFMGWLCNHLCLHYGGTPLFNKVRNVFIGLIIGDFMMGGIWAVIGIFAGQSYQVLPA